jgi:hypothetical protein
VLQYVRGCALAISMFKALAAGYDASATSIGDGTEARRLEQADMRRTSSLNKRSQVC